MIEQVQGQVQVLLGYELTNIIEANGFKVNQQKVRLQTANHRQEVTGLVTNKKVNVNRQYVSQIRAMLHAWEKFGYDAAEREYWEEYWRGDVSKTDKKLPTFKKTLKGKIEFLGMIRGKDDSVCTDPQKLDTKSITLRV